MLLVDVLMLLYSLSLKTFRQSSCAFYLTIMSAFDVGRFFSNMLAYVMRWGFGIDWGLSSSFFCRIRYSMFATFSLCSMTCLCLAIIDQYFATSARPRWRQWSNIKLAHRVTIIVITIWVLHGIPFILFDNQVTSSLTNTTTCPVTNDIFNQYLTYGYYLTLTNVLPLITVVFGLMAYHNARHLAHRTVPLVRRELDKQLIVMVLVQVLINFCMVLPFSVYMIFSLTVNNNDPVFLAKKSLAYTITSYFVVLGYMVRILSIASDANRLLFNFRAHVTHMFVYRKDFVAS